MRAPKARGLGQLAPAFPNPVSKNTRLAPKKFRNFSAMNEGAFGAIVYTPSLSMGLMSCVAPLTCIIQHAPRHTQIHNHSHTRTHTHTHACNFCWAVSQNDLYKRHYMVLASLIHMQHTHTHKHIAIPMHTT